MLVRSSIDALKARFTRRPTRRRPPLRGGVRRAAGLARPLHVESLEDRCLMALDAVATYATGDYPMSVVAADFNGDGKPDLAAANHDSGNVSVLLGKADGTFQSAMNSPTSGPRSVAVGDFNADGKLDLATVNDSDVSVLLGNGHGGFAAPASINSGSYPNSVAVGDFNADGKLDLAVGGHRSYYVPQYGGGGWWINQTNVSVLIGSGDGTFGLQASYDLWGSLVSPTAVTVADFNRDGRDDLAVVSTAYTSVAVLLGTATGLGAPAGFNTAGSYLEAVKAGDFTGDGILDLAIAGNTVDILRGNGDGTFIPVVQQSVDPVAFAPADFNGDGKLDLVTVDGGNAVSVLLGTGAGALALPIVFAVGSPRAVVAGDFNGDGRPDVAAANSYSDDVSVLLNDGIWPPLDAPTISITDVTVTEGNAGTVTATFNVSLSAAYTQPVSIHYTTASGTAVAGSDFVAVEGTLTFSPGQTSRPITVQINGDQVAENTEAFYVDLTSPTNAFVTDSQGVGVIVDDEPTVSIDSYVSTQEGNSGTTELSFNVTLSRPYEGTVTVPFTTADLTPGEEYWYGPAATAGVDYTANSGTLTFVPGDTSETITVIVRGDRIPEPDELFWVNLGPSTSAHLSSSQTIGAILNDEPNAYFNGSASVVEGHSGSKDMVFTVLLSAPYDAPISFAFATADGSATAGSDYHATTGSVRFEIGQTMQTISIPVNGDRLGEYDESFYVNLTSGYGSSGYGYIVDDEPRVSIDSDPVYVTEGNTGTTNAKFAVRLSTPYDLAARVNLSVVEGDTDYYIGDDYYGYTSYPPATLITDFEGGSRTITFNPGDLTKEITVPVNGDREGEPDEYFLVNLNSSDYGLIVAPQAVGIIDDDEPIVSISGGATVVEGNTGTKSLIFTISLSAAPDASNAPVTVSYATADGSATVAGGDYQAKTDTVSFGIGETSKQITVLVNGDRLAEYDESLYVNLIAANGAIISYYATGYGAIVDNEPRLSINSLSITEGNSGTKLLTFTVTLSAAYDQAVTVRYATQDGSAIAGSDYVAASGTLTFAPFQTTKTITVTIKGDKQKEKDEYFYLVLSGASSNAMISNAGVGTILDDEPGKGGKP